MQVKISTIFITIYTAISFVASGQIQKVGIPELEYFNRRQYGAATQNWEISQSKYGFMYFANNDGVLEYDGEQWRLLEEVNNHIVRSVQCIDDRIYVGTYNELGYFEYDSIQHLKYNTLAVRPELKSFGDYWDIYNWNGYVVFRSQLGICLFKNDKLIKVIEAPSSFMSSFVVNGLLLVQDEQSGLMELRGEDVYPIAGGQLFNKKEIASIVSSSNNEIIIGTIKNGLYKWNMKEIIPWNVPASSLMKKVNVFCGISYLNEYMVFGTIQGGVVIVSEDGNVFMQIDKDKGLVNNTVLSVGADKEGNVWCGLDNGIVRIGLNKSITFLQGYYNIGTGYAVTTFNSDYYLGTNQALFKIPEKKFHDPLKTRDDFIRIEGSDGQIWSLYDAGETLLCGHNFGAFEVVKGKLKQITPENINGVWNFKKVPGRDDLLISGTYRGLCVFKKTNQGWRFIHKVDGFEESSRYMEWDQNNNLWVSHGYQGLFRLHFNNSFTAVTKTDVFHDEDLPGNTSRLVLSKIDDKCVFCSKDGIYMIADDTASVFKVYHDLDFFFKKGLYPNYIKQDPFKNIWLFDGNGVQVLRYLEDGTYKKITYPFLPLERKLVNGFEYVYTKDDENVIFGIEDGFAHYYSKDVKNYQIPFDVHIRSFKSRNDSISYVVNFGVPQKITPKYKFKDNTFDIQFSASFMDQGGVEYLTSLMGEGQLFTDWSENAQQTLSNLREGDYVFEVRARNKYWIEAEPVSFRFTVMAPWYRSIYARVTYLLTLVLIVLFLVYFINRKLELSKQKEVLKKEEAFKVMEEKLKNEALESEKEMIKMRNDKLRSDMVYKEKELANSTIHLIQKNDLLSDIKKQLVRIVKVDDKTELDRKVKSLIKKIDRDIVDDNNWEVFEMHFGQVHDTFFNALKEKHPELTLREQKLCAYIKMGMSSKDIASLMNITTRAVENNRYKLRQKLGIHSGGNLLSYISSI